MKVRIPIIDAQQRPTAPRPAFTLVEMLVVLTLMMVLAGFMVMFWPQMSESQRAAEGGGLLEGWLKIAKQRALRDQAPRGLRLYIDGTKVTQAQYLEQAPDYKSGSLVVPDTTKPDQVRLSNMTVTGTIADLVQPGDSVVVVSSGAVHTISSVDATNNLLIVSPPLSATELLGMPTTNFTVIRAARPADGDRLELPRDIGIDLAFSQYSGAGGFFDILFAPSGNVIGSQAHLDFLVLWVRNLTYTSGANPEFDGEPSLISVHVRSGLVAAYPPNHDPTSMTTRYKFVIEGGTQGP